MGALGEVRIAGANVLHMVHAVTGLWVALTEVGIRRGMKHGGLQSPRAPEEIHGRRMFSAARECDVDTIFFEAPAKGSSGRPRDLGGLEFVYPSEQGLRPQQRRSRTPAVGLWNSACGASSKNVRRRFPCRVLMDCHRPAIRLAIPPAPLLAALTGGGVRPFASRSTPTQP